MSVRLFVSNLSYSVTEAELRAHFATIGPVASLSLPTDRETGRPRGFAFVEFSDRTHAEEAIRRFNNQVFMGRPLVVNEARPREDRPPSSAPSRPPINRPDSPVDQAPPEAGASGNRQSRNFGPDATPRRNRNKGGAKAERGPKGPMRERVTGRFFGGDDSEDEEEEIGGEDFLEHEHDEADEDNDEDKD